MNNYTTARAPLRMSENSHLLMQLLLGEPEPIAAKAPAAPGNYVGVGVKDFTKEQRARLAGLKGLSGSKIRSSKLHVTVMYSPSSDVPHELIKELTKTYKLEPVQVVGAAAFDALDKERTDLATIVLKLKAPQLVKLNRALKLLGCVHSYPTFSPHVSLYYDVPKGQCEAAVKLLNKEFKGNPMYLELAKWDICNIDDDWGKSAEAVRK